MQRILRPVLVLTLLVAAMAGVAACGSGDDGGGGAGAKASADTDATTVVKTALTSTQDIKRGKLNVTFKVSSTAANGGTFEGKLSGPFESAGAAKVPKVDFDATFTGGGQNVKGGVELTGSKAFVAFNGKEYVLDDATYGQFASSYEQSAKRSGGKSEDALRKLGIDPADWLDHPKNAGEGQVAGEDVVKATGAVDVETLLTDVNTLIAKAGSLGLSGSTTVPGKLTDAQIKMAKDAITKADVEIDAAKDDSTLRRAVITIAAVNPDKRSETIDATVDITLSDVGEAQDFPEPAGAQPFAQLLQQFGGLGALGGGSSGSGSGGSGGSGSGSAEQQKLEDYTDCIKAAGSDTAKAQACADKLG